KVTQIEVDGETEQDQLHHRHDDDHAQGHPVTTHLPQFLDDNGEQAARVHAARSLATRSPSRVTATNTSSRFGSASSTSASVPAVSSASRKRASVSPSSRISTRKALPTCATAMTSSTPV